ncbi:MAG: hypothetical protein WCD76_09580, partial [Pyrinomonadaceae bacterium]
MTKKRTDQTLLIDIALRLRVKPRATRFDKEYNLLEVDYSYLKLSELPPEICLLHNLQALNLNGNLLTTLPAEINQLTKLTRLYIASNQFQTLPPELWNLTNLETLDLGVVYSFQTFNEAPDEYDYDDENDDDEDDDNDDKGNYYETDEDDMYN